MADKRAIIGSEERSDESTLATNRSAMTTLRVRFFTSVSRGQRREDVLEKRHS
jgi:hypothetical protein